MKKVHLDFIFRYPNEYKYSEADKLGRRLLDYLGEGLFTLLLDSKVLINTYIASVKDEGYKLHPASKVLEGFLDKVADGKGLRANKEDKILGNIFSEQNPRLKEKIKDKKLIKKVNVVWEFCRNDIMHYRKDGEPRFGSIHAKYEEIVEIIIELYKDFYGKTEPDEEIKKGFNEYISKRFDSRKYRLKERIVRWVRRI